MPPKNSLSSLHTSLSAIRWNDVILSRGYLLHQPYDYVDSVFVRNLFILWGNRPEKLELSHEDSQFVFLLTVRDIGRIKEIEIAAVDQAYELQKIGSAATEYKHCSSYQCPERPNIRCGIPRSLEERFRTPPYRCTNRRPLFRVLGIQVACASPVGSLSVGESNIVTSWSVVDKNVVRLNVYRDPISDALPVWT